MASFGWKMKKSMHKRISWTWKTHKFLERQTLLNRFSWINLRSRWKRSWSKQSRAPRLMTLWARTISRPKSEKSLTCRKTWKDKKSTIVRSGSAMSRLLSNIRHGQDKMYSIRASIWSKASGLQISWARFESGLGVATGLSRRSAVYWRLPAWTPSLSISWPSV